MNPGFQKFARGASLAALTAAPLLILLCFVWPGSPAWAEVTFTLLAALFPTTLIALGAGRRGRLGVAGLAIGLLAVVLLTLMAGMLIYRGSTASGQRLGGLPLVTAIQLYGLFLLPLIVSSLGYAWSFERWGLRDSDLKALRERFGKTADAGAPEQESRR